MRAFLHDRMGRRPQEIIQNYGYTRWVEGILKAVQFIEAEKAALPAPQRTRP